MAGAETLFNLFLRAQEKYSEGCTNFEEHFSWLEEVVATARQAFATLEPALLPKTPRTKKKTQKRPLQPCIAEEAESPPTKRTSTCSTDSNQNAHNPVEALPRRSRAAFRMAQEKMKKDLQNDGKRKLRRPSTPKLVTTTSRKIQGSRRAVHCRGSPEGDPSLPQVEERKVPSGIEEINGERLIVKLQAEQVLDPKPAVNNVSSHDTPKKKSDSTIRVSVRLSGERWPCVDTSQITDSSQNITQVMVTNLQQENGIDQACVLADDCTYSALRLDDSEDDKGEEKEMNVQISKAEIEIGKEREELSLHENSPQTLNEKPVISDKENKCLGEGVEVLPKPLENLPKPIPRGRTTRTKQRELPSSSEDDTCAHDTVVGAFDSPHPVPKPRFTRTKQKKEIHTEIVKNEVSGTHVLPPPENSNSRVTRTKTRAIKQDSNSEKEGSDSHFSGEEGADNCNQADSSLSDELPKPHSTRTKKKTVEVESDSENSVTRTANEEMTDTETQNTRITRTKKREVEEQTLEQPARSTRTKRKKVEEVPEKHSMDQENMSLHVTSAESEYEKERKSLKDELNSTYVKSDSSTTSKNTGKHDCFAESVSYEEPPVKSVYLSASCTSIRSAQNAEVVVVGRITRSKVRQLPPVKVTPNKVSPSIHSAKNVMSPKTPVHSSFKRVCCTPNSESETPKASAMHQRGIFRKSPVKHSSRPFSSSGPGHMVCSTVTAYENHIREALNEVEELTSEDCEVPCSPAQVIRHSLRKAYKRESSTRRYARKSLKRALEIARAAEVKKAVNHIKAQDSNGMQKNNLSKTVSPVFPLEKVIRLKVNHISSSGSITPKTFSRIQPTYSSSSEYSKTQKKIGTPNEIKRGGNIISGLTSFIKVQPAKVSREDLEEKRLAEMQRKRERVEETRKKKDELLKSKAEEQKRRNEERMRRVHEAREERERKALEAKEQQKKDRQEREERQREEQQRRKQQLLAKKRAEEEAKVRKIREQQEEERKRQEEEIRKLMEEEKRAEEAKRLEEEKLAHMAEQHRLQEEEKKRRQAEAERIARERMELERLRLREAERIAEGKQIKIISSSAKKVALNDTYTASDNKENSDHNSTFTKTSSSSQSNSSGKELANKYEMTPNYKKTKKEDALISNYNIADMKSDDSTDDESAPKKKIPSWALTSQLKVALINQEYYPPAVEKIFPPDNLLIMPDLSQMFPIQRRRFHKRTSSAIWNTPPAKFFESN